MALSCLRGESKGLSSESSLDGRGGLLGGVEARTGDSTTLDFESFREVAAARKRRLTSSSFSCGALGGGALGGGSLGGGGAGSRDLGGGSERGLLPGCLPLFLTETAFCCPLRRKLPALERPAGPAAEALSPGDSRRGLGIMPISAVAVTVVPGFGEEEGGGANI